MTYFTSDQHFGHFNIIRLNHRPCASADCARGDMRHVKVEVSIEK